MKSPVASMPLVTGPNLDIQLLPSSVVFPLLSPAPSLHLPLQATWNNKIGQFMKPQQNRNHLTLPIEYQLKIYSTFHIIVQCVFSILQSNRNIQMVTCYLLDISTGCFLHGTQQGLVLLSSVFVNLFQPFPILAHGVQCNKSSFGKMPLFKKKILLLH